MKVLRNFHSYIFLNITADFAALFGNETAKSMDVNVFTVRE